LTEKSRGIGVTQAQPGQNSPLTYAGGGQSGTELGQLAANQALRQEAQTRSANQNLQGLQSSLQKSLTNTGQQLSSNAQNLSQQKQSDIINRANTYYGLYQNQQQGNQVQNLQKQQNATMMSPYYPNLTGANISQLYSTTPTNQPKI